MSLYMKWDKIYPGEIRILNALYKKGPLTFTELTEHARINRVTLSEYLKRLTVKGYVEHDKTGHKKYSFPKICNPLVESSFPEFQKETKRLIELADISRKIYGDKSLESKFLAQKFLLKVLFYTFLSDLHLALVHAIAEHNKGEDAQKFIQRFVEWSLSPRLQVFILEAFEDKDVFREVSSENVNKVMAEAEELLAEFESLREIHAN